MNPTLTAPLKILCRLLSAAFLLFSLNTLAHADSAAPGGFLENDEAPAARALFSPASTGSFLPSGRGGFTFPAPYNTHGIRVTTASDCGGNDCVDMIYSYWKNMSNSSGSDTMYIFIGLDQQRGGDGPTLFKYVKSTDKLTKVGPLFASSSVYARQSGEGWYFSYGLPTKLYMQDHSKLLRYDVLSHAFETVFDTTTQYPNTIVTQTNSSNDDNVHSATLEDATSYAKKGCLVYTTSSKQFQFFAANGKFDECQIDKGGRYLVIKEKTPADTCASCDEDDVVVDLSTGKQQVLMDEDGAGGHSDLGYGYMVASDNWNKQPNAWRLWDLSNIKGSGGLVFHGGAWGSFSPSHVSFANAVGNKPIAQQYVCGGAAVSATDVGANDIRCFTLGDTDMASQQTLVVAPVMTSLSAAGGDATCPSCTDYGKDPKGNLDPTGQYFFWVSNAGGGRMDAFMVKVPYQVLTGGGSGDSSTVTITSPKQGADITGTLTVSATVSSNLDVAGVTFQIDGAEDTTAMAAPYEASWPIGSLSAGTHTLTATAMGTDGTTVQSAPVTFSVASSAGNGGVSNGGGSAPAAGGGGGGGAVSLIGLLFLGLGFQSRRHARRG